MKKVLWDQWKQQPIVVCQSWRIFHLNVKFLPSPSYLYRISWVELFYFSFTWLFWLISFLLPFEWLKNSKQIEGLVNWLVELPGKFTSERDSCPFSRVELLMTGGWMEPWGWLLPLRIALRHNCILISFLAGDQVGRCPRWADNKNTGGIWGTFHVPLWWWWKNESSIISGWVRNIDSQTGVAAWRTRESLFCNFVPWFQRPEIYYWGARWQSCLMGFMEQSCVRWARSCFCLLPRLGPSAAVSHRQ